MGTSTATARAKSLTPETSVTFRLNILFAGVISIISFTGGAMSIYFGQRADITDLKGRIENLNHGGSEAFQKSQPLIEDIRRDLTELKADVKWIARQIDASKTSRNLRGRSQTPSLVQPFGATLAKYPINNFPYTFSNDFYQR